MRFLHLADLHIGKQVNGFSMIQDQQYILEQIIAMLQEHEVEALVLAGDIYDKVSPGEEAVRLFDWFLTKVATLEIPTLVTPGNHDSAERLAFARALIESRGVYIPPVFDGTVENVVLEDELGIVRFWMLPFIRPAHVKRLFPGAEIGNSYTAAVKTVLGACDINPSERNILLAHQFVTAGEESPERADEELSLGGMDNVDASVFDAFDYVALGHVHRPQRIGRDTVRYSGSPLKYSFSETRYDKSAVLVDVQEKTVQKVGSCIQFQLLPLTPLRDVREIKGPLEMLVSDEVVASANATDYIRAVLTDETPQLDALNKIRSVYPNVMQVDYENSRTSSSTTQSPQAKDPKRVEPAGLFGEFFEAQTGHRATDEQTELVTKLLADITSQLAGGSR